MMLVHGFYDLIVIGNRFGQRNVSTDQQLPFVYDDHGFALRVIGVISEIFFLCVVLWLLRWPGVGEERGQRRQADWLGIRCCFGRYTPR